MSLSQHHVKFKKKVTVDAITNPMANYFYEERTPRDFSLRKKMN